MYQVRECIFCGETERTDGHKPHYSLSIHSLGADDHEGGLPADDLGQTSVGLIGLTVLDGIAQKTIAHWAFYSEHPQHYMDYEDSWNFDSYESARIFAVNREKEVAETMDIDFDLRVLFAESYKSPFNCKIRKPYEKTP